MGSWDKFVTIKLIEKGFTREQAGIVVGLIAEERQVADLQGYQRGFNAGYAKCQKEYINEGGISNPPQIQPQI